MISNKPVKNVDEPVKTMDEPVKDMGPFACPYCSRLFQMKKNWNQHTPLCEIMFHKKNQKADDFDESLQKMPTMKEMFQLMQTMAVKCNRLEKDLTLLRQTMKVRTNKSILHCLPLTKPNVTLLFSDWSHDWTVKTSDLETIFHNQLLHGFQKLMEREIKLCAFPPLCAFRHKPNSLFVYDIKQDKKSWKLLESEALHSLVKHLEKQFLKKFIQWSAENREMLSSTEEMRNREVQYMTKMICTESKIEKMTTELKKWLYATVVEDFVGHD